MRNSSPNLLYITGKMYQFFSFPFFRNVAISSPKRNPTDIDRRRLHRDKYRDSRSQRIEWKASRWFGAIDKRSQVDTRMLPRINERNDDDCLVQSRLS